MTTYSHPQFRSARLKNALQRFLRDEAAASAVFFAVTLSSTVGIVGLGAETGAWFSERRQYQTAADAGAIAGALSMVSQLNANNAASPALDTSVTGPAWKEAIRNGAATFVANTSVQDLTSGGVHVVHVEVSEQKNRILAAVTSLPFVTIKTAAEATVDDLGQPCINGLGTTKTVISISGNATVTAPKCVLTSNSTANEASPATNKSSVSVGGSATVDVAQIYSLGSVYLNGNPDVEAPLTGMGSAAGTANPFSSVAAPTAPAVPTSPTAISQPSGNTCTVTVAPSDSTFGSGVLCALPAGKNPGAGSVILSGHNWTTSGTDQVKGALTISAGANLTVPANTTLNVFGNLTVAGTLTVNGTLYVDGNVTSSGTMALNTGITLASTSNGATNILTVSGGTTSVGGDIQIAKGGLSVTGGTLTATKNIKIVNGDLSVSGGTLSVTGNVNLGSGNLPLSGGTTTFAGNVGLTSGNFAITGGTTTVNFTGTAKTAIVVGNFSIGSGGTLNGSSTTILLSGTSGYFDFDSNSTTNLTAPTIASGSPYAGIALYQDPAYTGNKDNNIGGGSSTILGAIYAKTGTVNFSGNRASDCTIIVAKVINFTGNSALNTAGCTNYVNLPHFFKVSLSL